LIYSDDQDAKLLVSSTYQMHGKPDFVYKQFDNTYLPVELKHKESKRPHLGDVMQLASYFILVEENYGVVKRGLLQYKNRTFYIRNSKRLRNKLLKQIAEMNRLEEGEAVKGFKKNENKCRSCAHRSICNQ